jgi:hypothetical protein
MVLDQMQRPEPVRQRRAQLPELLLMVDPDPLIAIPGDHWVEVVDVVVVLLHEEGGEVHVFARREEAGELRGAGIDVLGPVCV